MSKGKKRGIKKKEGRLSGKFKREAMFRIVKLTRAAWPGLTLVQVRRLMSFTYQGLRDGKGKKK